MKIYRVIIKNFRSIKFLDFKPDNVNVIIGRNNSGKTNILSAMDYCLNPYRNWYAGIVSEYDFYNKNLNSRINIEIWFDSFDEEDVARNDRDLCIEYVDQTDNIVDQNTMYYENATPIIRVTFECGDDLKPNFYFTKPELSGKRFTREDKELIGYHYIPAYRDPLKELSFYQNSFFSKLLEKEELQEEIDRVILDLNKAHEHLFKDSHFKSQFELLKRAIQNLRLISTDDDSMGLEVSAISNRRVLQNFGLVFKPDQSIKPIPLRYQGYGAQNAMLITTILQLIQSRLNRNLIVAFEEPEQNLEPYFQRILIKRISSLSSFINRDKGSQLFISTHSRDVVDMFRLRDVKIVNSAEKNSKHVLTPIIENSTDMKWKKFLNQLENKNKGEVINGFFAKAVLLVEGQSEKGGLPIFSRKLQNGLDEFGIELIWCGGKGEIPKYARYFGNLNLKVFSLFDNDIKSNKEEFGRIIENSVMTMIWSKNYETALLSSKEFGDNFFRICQEEYSWQSHKDVYLKNTFCAQDKGKALNKSLYDFYDSRSSDINNIASVTDLENFLRRENLLLDYQELFLHRSFNSARGARLIAENICCLGKIPIEIRKLFHLISQYYDGKFDTLRDGDLVNLRFLNIAKVTSTSPLVLQIL